ncbi:hypothetical protein RFN28_10410 [Mesorhizobium sp. VK24D]|uniref:Uncharacterized protein n=1 Tax=Mesorhizobium album TaxID=3072314 RepID=A0ABU4XW08_9HYPH|nr:hypothetical protein [Mesorhizobium sp. VK24D]MDX8478891.1 hypothetical protein [Mesorhizobium sp. VK24D]
MMEEKVREAMALELERQTESDPSKLRLELDGDRLTANGDIDLLALAPAIVGAVAGAP